MTARIYQPGKSATQSGAARAKQWLLEYEPEQPREIEPLMGWTSSGDMKSQIRLWFDTAEEALDYARRHGVPARVIEAAETSRKTISYSDNFKTSRFGQWTH
jgi:ETC complex I subunit conserved region